MDREMEILDELSQVAFSAARGEYEELHLEVGIEDNWIDAVFSQTAGGVTESLPTLSEVRDRSLMELSYELHKAIKNQNGGDLKKYSWRINKEGRATVVYEYGDPK